MERFVRAVNKNTVLIGCNHLNLYNDALNTLQFKVSLLKAYCPVAFLDSCLGDRNFKDTIESADVSLLHFGLTNSYDREKIEQVQKLIWYLYSLNNRLEIYISFLATEKTPDLSSSDLHFNLKNCEALHPDCEKIYNNRDELIEYFFVNTYNCKTSNLKIRKNTETSVINIKQILEKKSGYTTYIDNEYDRIL